MREVSVCSVRRNRGRQDKETNENYIPDMSSAMSFLSIASRSGVRFVQDDLAYAHARL